MNEAVYHRDGTPIKRGTLMSVVEELDERYASVDSVAVRLNVTLLDTDKNKEHPLLGAYLGDKDGNMRLRITAPSNHLVLDMGRHGDIVEVYVARKDRYYRGKVADLMNNQSQLSLLAHAGGARDLFFPRAWTPNAVERRIIYGNGREMISVIEKPSFIRRRSRRLSIAPEAAAVEKMEVNDRYGRELGAICYADYHFPSAEAEPILVGYPPPKDSSTTPYPGRIILCPHNVPFRLVMDVAEIAFNLPIAPDKFEVPQPENTKVLDLGPALKRSGSLWE
ncbi:MAG: hypothetical protein NTW87_26765 [Planctomycetota bacterium]|nr:hypothetical protein [Planctomycetota bacterium]